jgi:hypothetical protein
MSGSFFARSAFIEKAVFGRCKFSLDINFLQ